MTPMTSGTKSPLRICLTGGGTAGHVTPHFALVPEFDRRSWSYYYIGGNGIERDLVKGRGIAFHTISTGKLRRYFSFQNALDVLKVAIGFVQAFYILLFKRPNVVFSKGGYVAVPVAIAARILGIPVVSHESDVTPGLATKIISRFAGKMIYTFPATGKYLGSSAVQTGTPVRQELFEGNRAAGLRLCGFADDGKPTIMVMGGSQGAMKINQALERILPRLVESYKIVHLTGAGKGLSFQHPSYRGFEFLREELADVMALADVVVSRAGANSIFEFLALKKPMLLIPLEEGSRGDQVLNAEEFFKSGWARVLREKDLTSDQLYSELQSLITAKDDIRANQSSFDGAGSAAKIIEVLQKASGVAVETPARTFA